MKKIFKTKHFISALTIFTLLFSAMLFEASAVDKNEVESNNTSSNATVTYDDYDNYGKISTAGDVDWWQITPTATGMANIWLGQIPSGCVYYLELYEFDGLWKLAESHRAVSDQQLIRAKVYGGVNYKIKVYSNTGYSSTAKYKLRVKNYTETQEARVYTLSSISNYQDIGSAVTSHTTSMGFNDIHRVDYTATKVYNQIDDMDLAVVVGIGGETSTGGGRVTLASNTNLIGKSVTNGLAGYKGISDHVAQAMADMQLICFQSNYSGTTTSTYGNLVDASIEKGAMCSIGWTGKVDFRDIELWNEYFFGSLDSGYSVEMSLEDTRDMMRDDAIYANQINAMYCGSSYTSALTLG